MGTKMRSLLLGLTILLATTACAIESRLASFETFVETSDRSSAAVEIAARRKFESIKPGFDSTHLKSIDDTTLVRLFQAAFAGAYYFDASYVPFAERANEELERRGRSEFTDDLLEVEIVHRRFASAQRLAARIGVEMPVIVDETEGKSGGATVLHVAPDESFHRIPSVLEGRDALVVVGSPRCHFTEDAAQAISADAELHRLFSSVSIWLAPPTETLDAKLYTKWRQRFPFASFDVAWSRKEWELIPLWNTPTFYFLRDGRVVAQLVGWPPGGGRKALLDAASRTFTSH